MPSNYQPQQGQTIRLGLKDIPALGRATQGVRIMRLSDGDKVVSLALVKKATEEEEAAENAALALEEAPADEKPAKKK
jgi:DNA gyrase subunit A